MIFYSDREYAALSDEQKREYQKFLADFRAQEGFLANFVISDSTLVKPSFQECLDAAKEHLLNSDLKYEIVHIYEHGKLVHEFFYRNYSKPKFSESRFFNYFKK